MNKEKIKKFVLEHEEEVQQMLIGAFVGAVTIAAYTYGCKKFGYRMTKPSHYDEEYFYVKTIGGNMLRSRRLDTV